MRSISYFSKFVAAILLANLVSVSAHAETTTTVLKDKDGSFTGCMSIDSETDIGYLGVENTLMFHVNSKLLHAPKGETVNGIWSVDEGKNHTFTDKASESNVLFFELKDAANLKEITDGNKLTVTNGDNVVEFDLNGTSKLFEEVQACMKKNLVKK